MKYYKLDLDMTKIEEGFINQNIRVLIRLDLQKDLLHFIMNLFVCNFVLAVGGGEFLLRIYVLVVSSILYFSNTPFVLLIKSPMP